MDQNALKQAAAQRAVEYVKNKRIIGIGTGSTVNYFIEALAQIKGQIEGTVASSVASENLLKQHNIPVYDLTAVDEVSLYVDGADEFNVHKQLIKGGGGALTREKIVAACAREFVCIVDASKSVKYLGQTHFLPIEVIPMARSYVARKMVALGGDPQYREGFVTDNGNIIIDVHNLKITDPVDLEAKINNITGVVCNGLFAMRGADRVLVSQASGIEVIE